MVMIEQIVRKQFVPQIPVGSHLDQSRGVLRIKKELEVKLTVRQHGKNKYRN
jgi:hypothetical protein